MHTALDTPVSHSTGPHVDLPPAIVNASMAIGAWVRNTHVTLIGAMTLVAAAFGFHDVVKAGRVTIADVLLLFIYLEIWAMIVVEATTRRLPVNFIIHIAITVLI